MWDGRAPNMANFTAASCRARSATHYCSILYSLSFGVNQTVKLHEMFI